jgi:uncharacterized lipoprotein
MKPTLVIAGVAAVMGLAACSRSDQAPRPSQSAVAASMPDAASTPGATGPATVAPHDTPPPAPSLADTQSSTAGAPGSGDTSAPAPK